MSSCVDKCAANSRSLFVEDVGGFWRSHKLSPRRMRKAIMQGIKYFRLQGYCDKPRALIYENGFGWHIGMWV
jgi:hypothetical protein